jgi:hypothetical protein
MGDYQSVSILSGIERCTDEIHSPMVSGHTPVCDNEAKAKPQPAQKGEVLAKLGGEVCVIEQELVEMTRDARESNEERQLRNRVAGAYTSLWNVQCF